MKANEQGEYFDGFAWALPSAFAEPLGACRFEQGDALYDTNHAYEGTWGEAVPRVSYMIQVKHPPRGAVTKARKEEESAFSDNWRQRVVFDLTDYEKKETVEFTTTQGRLYSLLWTGNLGCVDERACDPPVPTLAMGILGDLPKAVHHFRGSVVPDTKRGSMFLMPHDRARELLTTKFRKVKDALSASFTTRLAFARARPGEAGLRSQSGFAPTVEIVCFFVADESPAVVEKILKNVLHKPAKNKKTKKEKFRIRAHGHLQAV